ncbi:MAG TPA: hypothetical protein VJ783_19425 [Pirellulales bacterium]|nr:hypothetical protein [Pirellulales bacterium]
MPKWESIQDLTNQYATLVGYLKVFPPPPSEQPESPPDNSPDAASSDSVDAAPPPASATGEAAP